MRVLWLCLFVCVASSMRHDCHHCDLNCGSKYTEAVFLDACKSGCRLSKGPNSRSDEFNVNVDCEQGCEGYGTNEERSACYGGCTYVPAALIADRGNNSTHFRIFADPIISRIISMFLPNRVAKTSDDETVIRRAHIRVLVPEGLVNEDDPQPMMGNNMQMMMKVMHGSDDISDAFQLPQMHRDIYEEEVPTFSSSFCRRARVALHHLATHPLFLASVILMFVTSLSLLVFACVRFSTYRSRRAASQRKYRRLPAFYKPAPVKVSLLTPQPTSEDEAPELPPKEPIV